MDQMGMMSTMSLLQPAVALAGWTVVMLVWMYAKRIPAMQAAKMTPDGSKHPEDFNKLPAAARQVADNYNHLFEAPTVFYAVVLLIAVAGHADNIYTQLAWAFVALRIIHSLVQAISNRVMVRFGIFMLSWLALAVMIVREAMMVF